MDNLSLKFAKESMLRQVDECTDLTELKNLTRSLVQSHFSARALISTLMLQGIEETRNRYNSNCQDL